MLNIGGIYIFNPKYHRIYPKSLWEYTGQEVELIGINDDAIGSVEYHIEFRDGKRIHVHKDLLGVLKHREINIGDCKIQDLF